MPIKTKGLTNVSRLVFLLIKIRERLFFIGTILFTFIPFPFYFSSSFANQSAQTDVPLLLVDVRINLEKLITEEDIDSDKKITIEDIESSKGPRGDGRFWLLGIDGKRYEVVGTYYLSNLLQELKKALDSGKETETIDPEVIFENPVDRLSRLIRETYWDNLTRRIDCDSLEQILKDDKVTTDDLHYFYVPHADTLAYDYFVRLSKKRRDLHLKVIRLPEDISPTYVKTLEGRHGLLSLALRDTREGEYVGVPFVVPGGRFNEMYGWDSYFEALGLLEDGRVELARAMVDNFVYQIRFYGKILNANRTYYLTRSQPPFLTSMALAVYAHLPKNTDSKNWLKTVISASIEEYHQVWMNEDRLTETGLSRYYGNGIGPPTEVEPGHFDAIYAPYASMFGLDISSFEAKYKSGAIEVRELDRFFVHDRSVRESGHDTTYRWYLNGDRCADFVTVDLNSLLYKIELDIGRVIDREFGGVLEGSGGNIENSSTWYARARKRKALIHQYLCNEDCGMFFDYDFINQIRHTYVSATTFYPLWACHKDDPRSYLVTRDQASRLVQAALPLLEMPGGVAASSEASRGPLSDMRPARQWDYPNGWAPHQMLIWQGLLNYGFEEIAFRLIYSWLYTITRNAADYNGTVPEKLDVVNRSHKVFAEYGNVGTEFDYITQEGFGWMNASYQVGLKLLPPDLRSYLERLVPPERIFDH